MAESEHDVKSSADAEPEGAAKKGKGDRHKSRKGGPSGPPLGKNAARGPRIKPPPMPKPPKAPPALGAELGEPPSLLGVATAAEVWPMPGQSAIEEKEQAAPAKTPPTPTPDPLCAYLSRLYNRVDRIDTYVSEARRSTADTQRYAAQAQAQAAEAARRVTAHRTEVAAWMEMYTPGMVQQIFERQQDWVARTHQTVGTLIQQMLVLTGVASCLDVLQPTPEGRLAVLRALLWTCDQGHDWWREHYRDERTIEGWAQWAVEQHRATERPGREYFKDRAPDYTADEEADRTVGMLGEGGTDPLAESDEDDDLADELAKGGGA